MKRILSALIAIGFMISAAACASAETGTPALGVENNKIMVTNAAQNGTLILAFYDDGVLDGANMYQGSGTIEADISNAPDSADKVKAFYWDMKNIMPIGIMIDLPLTGGSAEEPKQEDNIVMVKIGDKEFSATLYDNQTATVFKDMLPLTLDMSELNGNEKYFYLSSSLPNNSERVGTINAGDIMLYGSSCVVLFYETFDTSYSYTKIGHIDDVTGLREAVGGGSVTVTFE